MPRSPSTSALWVAWATRQTRSWAGNTLACVMRTTATPRLSPRPAPCTRRRGTKKKWDRELEAQLAELQGPEFLISTATGALDEAEALLSNCSNELSTRVELLDTFEDPHNQEHWQQIEREARSGLVTLD